MWLGSIKYNPKNRNTKKQTPTTAFVVKNAFCIAASETSE